MALKPACFCSMLAISFKIGLDGLHYRNKLFKKSITHLRFFFHFLKTNKKPKKIVLCRNFSGTFISEFEWVMDCLMQILK